jgi:hypothetical protein
MHASPVTQSSDEAQGAVQPPSAIPSQSSSSPLPHVSARAHPATTQTVSMQSCPTAQSTPIAHEARPQRFPESVASSGAQSIASGEPSRS